MDTGIARLVANGHKRAKENFCHFSAGQNLMAGEKSDGIRSIRQAREIRLATRP
jgi:hypothetical protein